MIRPAIIFALLASPWIMAQELPEPVAPPLATETSVPDDGVRVAVLGYHDFSETAPETAMRIRTSKFRKQMETIRQLGITVVTMEDFIAWKSGTKEIPQKSIVITLDDGWKSVYTDAFPILREFKYPFTLYLYKNYVDGGGKALTTPMIQEMMANGASIGSHSVSHPFPIKVKSYRKKGPNAYDAYLRKEMGESKRFLESKFGGNITTYSYPGGFHTEEMFKLGREFGYTQLFTVLPGKVKRGLPDEILPRYMILGNYDKIFEFATSFRDDSVAASPLGLPPDLVQTTPYPVVPEAGAIINTRLPEISADLTNVADLDPASLVMSVSGFGQVPATFTPEDRKFSWLVNRRLRQPSCQVSVSWKDATGKPATPLRWSFKIDRASAYLPDGE